MGLRTLRVRAASGEAGAAFAQNGTEEDWVSVHSPSPGVNGKKCKKIVFWNSWSCANQRWSTMRDAFLEPVEMFAVACPQPGFAGSGRAVR